MKNPEEKRSRSAAESPARSPEKEKEIEAAMNELIQTPKDELYSYDTFFETLIMTNAIGQSTIHEDKLTTLAQAKITKGEYWEGAEGTITVKLKACECRKAFQSKGGSFYKQLDMTCRRLTSRSMGYSNARKKEFEYFSPVNNADYRDGMVIINYNSKMKRYFLDKKEGYTSLDTDLVACRLRTHAGMKLYKMIKSIMWDQFLIQGKTNLYGIQYGLAELKFRFGLVDITEPKVNDILAKAKDGKKPDFEAALQVASTVKYDSYKNFKARYIDVAVSEINEMTDITVECKSVAGPHGKVLGVSFLASYKDVVPAEEKFLDDDALLDEFFNIVTDVRVKMKDARAILQAADYDLDEIRAAYRYISLNIGLDRVENFTGYMIDALNGDYYETEEPEEPEEPEKIEEKKPEKPARKKSAEKSGAKQSGRKKTPILDRGDDYSDVEDDI